MGERVGWLVVRLGVMGDVQYRGCKPRIEGIVKCTLRYCKILRIIKIIKRGGGWVQGARFDPKPSQIGEKDPQKKKKK